MDNEKKIPDFTEAWDFVTSGTVDPSSLNARDWLGIVEDSLDSCKNILRKMAEKRSNSMTMKAILNHPIEGCYDESRVTSKEVMDTLPKSLICNSSWIFIPVEVLETSEGKGQFFERRLFILADLANLMIVDTTFRKDMQPDQRIIPGKAPKINENVVGCKIFTNCNGYDLYSDKFVEMMVPYLTDTEMKLGEKIIKYILDYSITELREMKSAVSKAEEEMRQFLEIRRRLGYINHL
ncbi:MAG: hypothetical protein ACD_7C00509G0009 [uncultured bacterium]|nr:MAG: hypothetical protein ACD_7C00509G0009 [uncultured bacterium]HBR79139.1 hypothetical protein [Candidatus Moranbacteria bacterium]